MDFTKIKLKLFFNYKNIKEVYKLLQDGIGVRNINIFFYDKDKELFFDQIDKVIIYCKFMDDTSIIGRSFLNKKATFITNINKDKHYNLALDNPFKLDIESQIVIPIIDNNIVIGILRLSHLPYCFTYSDFKDMSVLDDIFKKIFLEEIVNEDNLNFITQSNSDRIKLFRSLTEMKKMFEKVSTCCEHKEIDKFIQIGKDNLDDILTYVNPSLDNISIIKKEMQQISTKDEEDTTSINILIADDIHLNVQILKAMLSGHKIINQIDVAYDGIETIEVLEKLDKSHKQIHLLFLDHHMPGILGSEVAKKIKSSKDTINNIIIVSITNDTSILEDNKHLYDYHIPKPFTRDNVKEVMKLIGKKY